MTFLSTQKISKLFRIRGGVHPHDCKTLSADKAIEDLPIRSLLHIPLQQHIGAAAKRAVKRGDHVSQGAHTCQQPGDDFRTHPCPHLRARRWGSGITPRTTPPACRYTPSPCNRMVRMSGWNSTHPLTRSRSNLPKSPLVSPLPESSAWVAQPSPSAVKLNLRNRYKLHTLVINGAECEPYLTCDDRLMREYSAHTIDGIRIMRNYALGVENIIIGIENNKPQAQAAMREAATAFPNIQVVGLPMRYPMGGAVTRV